MSRLENKDETNVIYYLEIDSFHDHVDTCVYCLLPYYAHQSIIFIMCVYKYDIYFTIEVIYSLQYSWSYVCLFILFSQYLNPLWIDHVDGF